MVSYKSSSVLGLASALLSFTSPCDAIVGGYTGAVGDYLFAVSVQTPGSGGLRQLGGGSIIGPKTVLAAAESCYGRDTSTIYIRYGSHNRTIGGVSAQVSSALIHPDWNPSTYASNLCLLYIDNLNLNVGGEDITPAVLATTPSAQRVGTELELVGWGFTAANTNPSSELQIAEQTVLSPEDCAKSWGDAQPILCATSVVDSGDDTSACFWDEGGPLYDAEHDVLVGVISHYDKACTTKTVPNVYADVYPALDWINANIK